MWLWVQYNKSPIYPIFYLLKGDCMRDGDVEHPNPRHPKFSGFVFR